MAEIQTNLTAYQVDYVCDVCEEGFMVSELVIPSDPPQYHHRCTNMKCQQTQTFPKSYPIIQQGSCESPKEVSES